MIVINNKRFAESSKEFTNSLFDSAIETCVGYAKRFKNRINLYDSVNKLIGCITSDLNLVKARKLENGKTWYSYGTVILIDNESTTDREQIAEDIKKLVKKYELNSRREIRAVYK